MYNEVKQMAQMSKIHGNIKQKDGSVNQGNNTQFVTFKQDFSQVNGDFFFQSNHLILKSIQLYLLFLILSKRFLLVQYDLLFWFNLLFSIQSCLILSR